MCNLIFIGGIHGVGKTTLCNELINTHSIPVFSASKIISELKNQNFPANKLIPDIDINQALLIEGLKRIKLENQTIILDGHFCLLDEKRNISKIPQAVFEEIRPDCCIVVTDIVSNISERLKTRDNLEYNPAFIEQFQDEEIAHAEFLSNKLNIPHFIFDNSGESKPLLHNFITKMGVI